MWACHGKPVPWGQGRTRRGRGARRVRQRVGSAELAGRGRSRRRVPGRPCRRSRVPLGCALSEHPWGFRPGGVSSAPRSPRPECHLRVAVLGAARRRVPCLRHPRLTCTAPGTLSPLIDTPPGLQPHGCSLQMPVSRPVDGRGAGGPWAQEQATDQRSALRATVTALGKPTSRRLQGTAPAGGQTATLGEDEVPLLPVSAVALLLGLLLGGQGVRAAPPPPCPWRHPPPGEALLQGRRCSRAVW